MEYRATAQQVLSHGQGSHLVSDQTDGAHLLRLISERSTYKFEERRGSVRTTLVVAAAAILGLITTEVTGSSHSVAEVTAVSARPPQPTLTTLDVTRSASVVSYCWSSPQPQGGTIGACADGTAGHAARTLRWRPRAPLRLDLHLPARAVRVDAAKHPERAQSVRDLIHIRLHRVDRAGRRWLFYLTPTTKGDTDLLISAWFARGDIEADIGLAGG